MPFTIRPETMNSFGEYIPKPTMKFVKQSTPNHLASYSYQNPIKKHLGRSYIGEGMNAETLFHELGHQRTNASELIPKSFKTEVKDKKNFRKDGDFSYKDEVFNGNMSYYTDPSEVETRLQLMRRDLKELGIHDYTLSHPTEKHIMKIKKLSDENSNKISRGTKDLMELYDAKVIKEWLKKLPVAVPAFIGLQQLNQEKEFGGTMKVLDTKIENNKKYYLINE